MSGSVLDRLWRLGLRGAYLLVRLRNRLLPTEIRGAYVAVWHRDRILVIRNSYRRDLNFPCGRRKRGEVLRETAARELREEVGIAVAPDALREIGPFPCRYEGADDLSEVFALELEEAPELSIDHREVVAAAFRPWLEVRDDAGLAPIPRAYLVRYGRDRRSPGTSDPTTPEG